MLDLQLELDAGRLKPFKTIAKSADGLKFLFISKEVMDDGFDFRFATMQRFENSDYTHSIGRTMTFDRQGRYHREFEPCFDLVLISRPWVPSVGQQVTVCGIAMEATRRNAFNYNIGHNRDSVCSIESAAPAHDGVGTSDQFYKITSAMYGTHVVHRDNLRRYRA